MASWLACVYRVMMHLGSLALEKNKRSLLLSCVTKASLVLGKLPCASIFGIV